MQNRLVTLQLDIEKDSIVLIAFRNWVASRANNIWLPAVYSGQMPAFVLFKIFDCRIPWRQPLEIPEITMLTTHVK